jgi:hypothetical protein
MYRGPVPVEDWIWIAGVPTRHSDCPHQWLIKYSKKKFLGIFLWMETKRDRLQMAVVECNMWCVMDTIGLACKFCIVII